MTKRQSKLIENLKANKHKTLTAAAKDAGYSPSTPHSLIERSIRGVLGKYLKALQKAGATDRKSARVISEGMDAVREHRSISGQLVDTSPDHQTRIKANDQYLKVKRLLESEEQGSGPVNVSVTVEIANENTPSQEPGNRISQYIQI